MTQVFIITKPVLTNSSGRVEPAQCLLDSDNWQLLRYDLESRDTTTVFTGYYMHCKALQKKLSAGEDVKKDMKEFEKESEQMRKKSMSFVSKISDKLKKNRG